MFKIKFMHLGWEYREYLLDLFELDDCDNYEDVRLQSDSYLKEKHNATVAYEKGMLVVCFPDEESYSLFLITAGRP